MNEPNTKIHYGKLKQNDLEKFVEIYKEIGLNAINQLPPVDSINEDNKKLIEFELTPNPFGEANNKLLIGIRYHQRSGNLYIDTQIHPGEKDIKNPQELQIKYNKLIREYFLRE